jgi:hypothetical protein
MMKSRGEEARDGGWGMKRGAVGRRAGLRRLDYRGWPNAKFVRNPAGMRGRTESGEQRTEIKIAGDPSLRSGRRAFDNRRAERIAPARFRGAQLHNSVVESSVRLADEISPDADDSSRLPPISFSVSEFRVSAFCSYPSVLRWFSSPDLQYIGAICNTPIHCMS